MRLLLDTVAFLFAIESPERLSRAVLSALQNPANTREISTISLTEVAVKCAIGKLAITKTDVLTAIEDSQLKVLPYTTDHALQLFDLPLHHRDPFDRQIIAQALVEGVPVVSNDPHFRLYKGLKLIW